MVILAMRWRMPSSAAASTCIPLASPVMQPVQLEWASSLEQSCTRYGLSLDGPITRPDTSMRLPLPDVGLVRLEVEAMKSGRFDTVASPYSGGRPTHVTKGLAASPSQWAMSRTINERPTAAVVCYRNISSVHIIPDQQIRRNQAHAIMGDNSNVGEPSLYEGRSPPL